MKRRDLITASTGLLGTRVLGKIGRPPLDRQHCKDVIVVIPGITGSVLQLRGKDVWSPSYSAIFSALSSLGRSFDSLILKSDPIDKDDLGDGVTATALVPDLHVIPGLWKIDGYSALRTQLFERLDLRSGENYIEFPYDWRRDNRVAARRLARLAPVWLNAWRKSSGHTDAKLIILAHSMGGLVAQYFVECLEGWRCVRALVTIGTPFRGSLNALNFVCNGLAKDIGPMKLGDLGPLLRSFTSTYQLLPRYPCISTGGAGLKRVIEVTNLPGLDVARARLGRSFLTEIEEHQKANAASAQYLSSDYVLVPITGGGQRTLQTALFTGEALETSFDYPGESFLGDGTVPEVSSIPIEFDTNPRLASRVRVMTGRHASLQCMESVVSQIVGLIKTRGELDRGSFSGNSIVRNALHVEDIYDEKAPVEIVCSTTAPAKHVTVSTIQLPSNTRLQRQQVKAEPEGQTVSLGRLSVGSYRVEVSAPGADTVSDIILVAGAE